MRFFHLEQNSFTFPCLLDGSLREKVCQVKGSEDLWNFGNRNKETVSPQAAGDPDYVSVPQQPGLLPVGSPDPIFRRASWGGGSQEQSGPHDHTGAAVKGCKQSAQFLLGTPEW